MKYEPTEWDKHYMNNGRAPEPQEEPGTWDAMMARLLDVLAGVGLVLLAVAVYQLCLHLGF